MDNQSNRSEGDFVFGSESDQSTKHAKVNIVNRLKINRNF